jgi:ParE toxin of type II toxin-antitoxin system, parDE
VTLPVRFLPEAIVELDEAVDFYSGRLSGLGLEFATEVRDGIARVQQHPKAWQSLGRRVRRYRLNRFPYGLVYAPLKTEVIILSVMHMHRAPNYWKSRLSQL